MGKVKGILEEDMIKQIRTALQYRRAIQWCNPKFMLIPEKEAWWKRLLRSLKCIS